MNTIRKIRWFWSWKDLAEEKWLQEMSDQGLHLKEVENPCFYIFEQGDPEKYVYKLDFYQNRAMYSHVGWFALAEKSAPQKSSEKEYFQLFKDVGWQYLGQNRNWNYFRQAENPGQVQELYTDQSSKEAMYRRQFFFQLGLLLFIGLFTILAIVYDLREASPVSIPTSVVGIPILILFAFPLAPLWFRLQKLKS